MVVRVNAPAPATVRPPSSLPPAASAPATDNARIVGSDAADTDRSAVAVTSALSMRAVMVLLTTFSARDTPKPTATPVVSPAAAAIATPPAAASMVELSVAVTATLAPIAVLLATISAVTTLSTSVQETAPAKPKATAPSAPLPESAPAKESERKVGPKVALTDTSPVAVTVALSMAAFAVPSTSL